MVLEAREPLAPSRVSSLQSPSPCSLPSSSFASATLLAMLVSFRLCCSSSSPMSSLSPPSSPSVPLPPTGRSRQEESTSCCRAPWGRNLGDQSESFSTLLTWSVVRCMSLPVWRLSLFIVILLQTINFPCKNKDIVIVPGPDKQLWRRSWCVHDRLA